MFSFEEEKDDEILNLSCESSDFEDVTTTLSDIRSYQYETRSSSSQPDSIDTKQTILLLLQQVGLLVIDSTVPSGK